MLRRVNVEIEPCWPRRTPSSDSIGLIADPDSAVAFGFAAELAEEGYRVHWVGSPELTASEPLAAVVVVVEHAAWVEALRKLDRSVQPPLLVLASTRRLAADVLPLLDARDDLATSGEPAAVAVWRLNRLIHLSTRMTNMQANLDTLTGLLNRRAFEERLRQAVETTTRDEHVGLLYLDLDHFKLINDRCGHAGGDQVLRDLGRLLSGALAPGDVIARLGGDEFACLLTRYDTASIIRDGERVLREIVEVQVPGVPADSTVRVAASAGLTFVRPGVSAEALMSEADVAAYQAKDDGRNRLCIYGQVADAAQESSRDLRVQHFEAVTRVATQRLVDMITLKSRRLVDAAKREADYCSLTGLHSRRYLDTRLPREIEFARSHGCELSLALVDLDHFHDVNMVHGWPTGDRVLQAFASVAQANVRASDWIARYGGEEFVIVMPGTTLESARLVVERVRQAFAANPVEGVERQRVVASLSAGVAQLRDASVSATELVNQASKALLRAKSAGRNVVEVESVS
jgi:two-component system cell cycle response regulator